MTHVLRMLLALVLTAGAFPALAQTPPSPPRELPLTVANLAGRVEVRRGASAWEIPKLRDEVAPGHAARALAGGRLTLRTPGGHALRVGQLSQVALTETQRGGADAPVQARLDGGHLWVAVGPGAVSAPAFEIVAGGASLSVYSGAASLLLGGDGTLLVRVHHGRVACKSGGAGGTWERTVKAGEELLVPAGAAPAVPRVLTRDRAEDLWVRWNREQDRAGGYAGTPAPR